MHLKRRGRVLALPQIFRPKPKHPPEFSSCTLLVTPGTASNCNSIVVEQTRLPRHALPSRPGRMFELLYPTAICGENCDLLGKTRAANAIFISCRHRHRSHSRWKVVIVLRLSFFVLRPSSVFRRPSSFVLRPLAALHFVQILITQFWQNAAQSFA